MVAWVLLSHSLFSDASPVALYPLLALFPLVIGLHFVFDLVSKRNGTTRSVFLCLSAYPTGVRGVDIYDYACEWQRFYLNSGLTFYRKITKKAP